MEQIKKDYPLSYNKLVEFIDEQNEGTLKELESMKEDTELIRKMLSSLNEKSIEIMLLVPRNMVNFFDGLNIHVDTTHIEGEGYDFEIREHKLYNKPYTTRELAEQAGVEQAFKVLEKQLSNERTKI